MQSQPRRGRPNRQQRPRDTPNPSHQNPPSRTPYRTARPENPIVPRYSSLTPGTPVSIILKADQPTGRLSYGFVAETLTRGDHPRGVKVRLRDGRVGRVQGLASESEAGAGEEQVGGAGAGLGRDGEARGGFAGRGFGGGGAYGRGGGAATYKHVTDIRGEDEYLYNENAPQARSLGAYFGALEEADAEAAGRGRGAGVEGFGAEEDVAVGVGKGSETVLCPVCGKFEGDERAVAWHVEGHFAES